MPSEGMHDISLINGRPLFRQRDSGHLAVPGWSSDTEPRLDRSSQREPAHETNRWRCRVHVNRALKLCGHREGFVCTAKVRTGFGKSDHPGSQGGLGKRGHGRTGNPLRNRKGGAGNPRPNVGAPQLYPDPTAKA
jgi:hypothetical protein